MLAVRKCFMLINKNLQEIVFNYCAQWSGVDWSRDWLFFYFNGRHVSHQIKISTRRNGFNKKRCTHPELLLFENNSLCLSISYPKLLWDVLKNVQNTSASYLVRLYIMIKMKMIMKDRWHRYGINRTRTAHDFVHTIYKMCLSMMMVICNE